MLHNYIQLIWLRGLAALKADANQSYLGTLWWILDPLMLTGLFYLAFSSGIRVGDGDNFLLFLICGLYPLKWTNSTLSNSANSLNSNKGIMGQMHLPKWLFPMIVNVTMFLRFMLVIPVLLGFIYFSQGSVDVHWASFLLILLCQLLFNMGISFMTSGWVPLIPDLSHIVPLLGTALLFTSGIFFDINDRPESIQQILRINPFVAIIENYRLVLLQGRTIEILSLTYPFIIGLGLIFSGLFTLKIFDRFYPRLLT